MSYSWFRQGTCTVSASDVVRFQGASITTAPNKPVVGDAFTVGGFRFYEIIFIGSDATGEYARLNRAYEEAAGSNISYAVARFASGTQNAKLVAMASAAINQKQISLDDMYEWYTSQEDTVQFLGPDGTFTTITTYYKLSQEITAVGGNSAAITVVANNINDVKTVATNIAAVNLVAPSIPAINAANDNMPAITAVNSEIQSVITVSENIPLLNAITPSIPAINNVNNNIATIAAVNADMVSVKNVSDNMVDVKDAKPQADRAESEADRAESEADKAMMAVTSLYAMSQVQFEANRANNKKVFAASGYESFGKVSRIAGHVAVKEGLYCVTSDISASNKLLLGRDDAFKLGASKSDMPIIHVAGVLFNIVGVGQADTFNFIKFPEAPDGKTTYNKSTGEVIKHATVAAAFAAQAADPTNVEVVIDRVDGWLKEVWAEEVSATNPYIYPNGLPQSIVTTMDGIATSDSNRPESYYAFFEGDASSKGKGLNFFALTDAQKKKVLANPKNNLVLLNDGRLIQWRLRIRTFAGAGNGDWQEIGTTPSGSMHLLSTPLLFVTPCGMKDTASAFSDTYPIYIAEGRVDAPATLSDLGVFQATLFGALPDETSGVNGECYSLFGGTVNRLNQGAYHPSFNHSGARLALVDGQYWNTTTNPFTSTASTFTQSYSASGNMGNGSGRPDGRSYDAIYADGQGGVCRDMRYSAYGVDTIDYAEADPKVKNGTYRGFEKLIFTRIISTSQAANTIPSTEINIIVPATTGMIVGDSGYIIANDGVTPVRVKIKTIYDATVIALVPWSTGGAFTSKPNTPFIHEGNQTQSVGGSFLQTDVIGNPVNILATPALANGWQGRWLPVIPNSAPQYFTLTRKNIIGSFVFTKTTDGFTWGSGSYYISTSLNATQDTLPLNAIQLCQYRAFAKQTENAVNTKVYGGTSGILGVSLVRLHSAEEGALLQESLTGTINKDTEGVMTSVTLKSCSLQNNGAFNTYYVYSPEHNEFFIQALPPKNGSNAVKFLNYAVEANQQAYIYYAYTELKHNGTSFGDDGKQAIVDNQSSKTDLNGNTVLVGTAKLKEPIGWIKNKD